MLFLTTRKIENLHVLQSVVLSPAHRVSGVPALNTHSRDLLQVNQALDVLDHDLVLDVLALQLRLQHEAHPGGRHDVHGPAGSHFSPEVIKL